MVQYQFPNHSYFLNFHTLSPHLIKMSRYEVHLNFQRGHLEPSAQPKSHNGPSGSIRLAGHFHNAQAYTSQEKSSFISVTQFPLKLPLSRI